MQDSKPLLQQVAQEIARSTNNSTTAVGRTDAARSGSDSAGRGQPAPGSPGAGESGGGNRDRQVDAINQVFELFRINYHNQYYSAFSNLETLNHAKRLWLETLRGFEPDTILRGAKRAIESCEYLPALNRMIRCCRGEPSRHGLPDVRQAYVEACQAPSPKAAYPWSHLAVYYAGRASDWYFLASHQEKIALPVFERHYMTLCERVIDGERLPPPDVKALPRETETPLGKAENLQRLRALRDSLRL